MTISVRQIHPVFVGEDTWRPWDLVMWDNRQVMHRVRRYDESQPRDMRRTTVAGAHDRASLAGVAATLGALAPRVSAETSPG